MVLLLTVVMFTHFFSVLEFSPRATLRFLNSLNSGVNVSSVDEKEILLTPLEGAQIFF